MSDKTRYANHAPISAEDGTVLYTCSECGAVVQRATTEIHDKWHRSLELMGSAAFFPI